MFPVSDGINQVIIRIMVIFIVILILFFILVILYFIHKLSKSITDNEERFNDNEYFFDRHRSDLKENEKKQGTSISDTDSSKS